MPPRHPDDPPFAEELQPDTLEARTDFLGLASILLQVANLAVVVYIAAALGLFL